MKDLIDQDLVSAINRIEKIIRFENISDDVKVLMVTNEIKRLR